MAEQELVELIRQGREERNLEYKRTLHWTRGARCLEAAEIEAAGSADYGAAEPRAVVQAKITKTVLAMANLPDGGDIVIGMRKSGNDYVADGMPPEDRDSFSQDGVSAVVNEYASPYVELTVSHVPYQDRLFVVIRVKQFDDLPIVCKKNGAQGLRRGAIYTRARRMIETVEVPSEIEMREILDRATEHRLRAFFAMQARVGAPGVAVPPSDAERFREERDAL